MRSTGIGPGLVTANSSFRLSDRSWRSQLRRSTSNHRSSFPQACWKQSRFGTYTQHRTIVSNELLPAPTRTSSLAAFNPQLPHSLGHRIHLCHFLLPTLSSPWIASPAICHLNQSNSSIANTSLYRTVHLRKSSCRQSRPTQIHRSQFRQRLRRPT